MTENLNYLIAHQNDYSPNEAVSARLIDKSMVMLVGPSAVGKTVVAKELEAQNADNYVVAGSFTTRPQRPNEPNTEFTFLPHDDETVTSIADEIRTGNILQYFVHPTSGNIYGSHAEDYPGTYNIRAIMASAVDAMNRVPFKSHHKVGIIVEPQIWLQRFVARKFSKLEGVQRLKESRNSVDWLLAQTSVHLVLNTTDKLSQTAEQVKDIVQGTHEEDPRARNIGYTLLRSIKGLIGE